MIIISLPARMVCIEKGCEAAEPVELCLLGMGTLGFRPATEEGKKWQLITQQGNPAAPLLTRCPAHASRLTTPPSAEKNILRSINGR